MANLNKAPCCECNRRCVTEDYNCHSHCSEYLAWRAMRDKLIEDRHLKNQAYYPGHNAKYRFPYNDRARRQKA